MLNFSARKKENQKKTSVCGSDNMRLRQLFTISRQLSTNNKNLRTTLKVTTQTLKLVGDWLVSIGDVAYRCDIGVLKMFTHNEV